MSKLPPFAAAWLTYAAAVSQTPPADLLPEIRWGLPMLAESGTVSYTRLFAGRIGDDAENDVVAIRTVGTQTQVVYLPGPMRHNMRVVVASDVVDAAVLDTGEPRDAIAVLTASGLAVHRCPEDEQTPELVCTSSSWQGATCVWAGKLQAGTPVVVGISASGTQLLRAAWNGSSLVEESLPVPPGITKMATMDWDGAGEVELVVQLGSTVYVLGWDGLTGIASFPFDANHAHAFTVSRGTGSAQHARDLLIAYGWYANQYVVLGAAGGGAAPLVGFVPVPAGFTVSDLRCCELDDPTVSPRLDEVLLACGGDSAQNAQQAKVLVVRRVDTSSLFAPSLEQARMVCGPMLPDVPLAAVVGADFDGDGDGDIVAVQDDGQIMQVFGGDTAPRQRVLTTLALLNEGGPGPVEFAASCPLPAGWQQLAAPGETLRLEFVGWFGGLEGYETGASLLDDTVLDPNWPVTHVELMLQGPDWNSLPGDPWSLELHTRLVVVAAGGERRLLPPWVTFYTLDPVLAFERSNWLTVATTGACKHPGEPGDPNTGGGTTDPPQSEPPRRP